MLTRYRDSPAFDINSLEPGTGNTPLHVAAKYGRSDIVMYLLSFDDINDTILNAQGKQPVELARTPELAEAMQVVRAQYVEKVAVKMKQYFDHNNIQGLEQLLSNPRAATLLDINGQDPTTGSTVLHDFVKKKNIPMVEFILSHGGDPLSRNSKGVLPIELTKDDTLRKMLKRSTKSQQVIINPSSASVFSNTSKSPTEAHSAVSGKGEDSEEAHPSLTGPPPSMKGFLKKWTNITGGYKLRWFVLENGVLSYYKRQDDIQSACRGSINMRQARLHLDSSEKLQFEVYSGSSVKFHLKANHPIETNRWVWALTNAIQYAKDEAKLKSMQNNHRLYQSSSTNRVKPNQNINPQVSPLQQEPLHTTTSSGTVGTSSINANNDEFDRNSIHSHNVAKLVHMNNVAIENRGNINFDRDEEEEEEEEADLLNRDEPPHTQELTSTQDSISVGLESVERVIRSLSAKTNNGSLSKDELKTGLASLEEALAMINTLVGQYTRQVSDREYFYKTKLDSSNQLQELWTQSIKDLELEKEKIQEQLHIALQKKRQAKNLLREAAANGLLTPPEGQNAAHSRRSTIGVNRRTSILGVGGAFPIPEVSKIPQDEDVSAPSQEKQGADLDESESESELEDEFFDALGSEDEEYIEEPVPPNVILLKNKELHPPQPTQPPPPPPVSGATGNVPPSSATVSRQMGHDNVQQTKEQEQQFQSGAAPSISSGGSVAPSILEKENTLELTEPQLKKLNKIIQDNSFAGYEDGPRKRLTLDDDNRPKISLWGVLKNLIGKDMTRMTLPVSFNECTNLLQRSAEDMEYTDLLDKAATIVDDPGERMAYVAAFAASSYSSTIDRVAKPFNPLLGETFEYARPDMGYRMFSEQVSHHPPIGAMMAESPRWDFYGASNVKSKFTGRSFDINPLGLWYVTLRPNKGAGIEEELYSFRKLTSTVVGIITGNPVVDNYGDMEIVNYTLGYRCLIKFKARGWRGNGAYELRGTVFDPNNEAKWIVGGRWNDKIFGRKLVGDEVRLVSDGKHEEGDLGEKTSRVLLWKVHDRPKSPFNLTAFAITLNALPESLKNWVIRTDTRFRPDQRAMEEGRYDDASEEKHRVEEKQRAARRKREQEGIEYNPMWFEKAIHPISKQEYWKYKGSYWERRAAHEWQGIPDIF